MSEDLNKEELKHNVASQETWMRLLFIVVYGAILWLASIVLAFVVVFQFLSVLFTRETQKNLLDFGASLAEYVREVVRYLTFNSEYKPFPFGDWPGARGVIVTEPAVAKKKTSSRRKPPVDTDPGL